MTDQIDQATDSELNEAFAVEVAGLTLGKDDEGGVLAADAHGYKVWLPLPDYSTDANAVLPWLEKCYQVSNVFEKGRWFVGIDREDGSGRWFVSATAPTFARAAVIALIRAHRATSSETSSTAPTPPPR